MIGVSNQGVMVECPECGGRNPDWARLCQTCGAVIEHLARPPGHRGPATSTETPKWVWVCYYLVSVYMCLSGALLLLTCVKGLSDPTAAQALGCLLYPFLVVGAVYVLTGLGLVFQVELARGVVNVVAGLMILGGLWGLANSLIGAGFFGAAAIPAMLRNILDVALGGFMIYLIGETDRRAPNL